MRRAVLFTLGLLLAAGPVLAQAPSAAEAPRGEIFSGTVYDAELFRDLPVADNPFALLDATQPTTIADRFANGGLYAGQPSRIGGFLSSWTQTLFRVGDVDITDASGSGAPLLFPNLFLWSRVDARTAMMPAGVNAPGLVVTFRPRTPSPTWTQEIDVSTSHGSLTASAPASGAPPIARLDGWDRGSALVSGPLIPDLLGGVFAVSWLRGSQVYRSDPTAVDATLATGFAHLRLTPDQFTEGTATAWFQHATSPIDGRLAVREPGLGGNENAGHVQVSWSENQPGGIPWRAFGSYSLRRRTPDTSLSGLVLDRLSDGPVSQLSSLSQDTLQQWSVGARASSSAGFEAGVDLRGARLSASDFASGTVGELVAGLPARLWVFRSPGAESHRSTLSISAHAGGQWLLTEALQASASIGFDRASGSAEGAATGIAWPIWLPRAGLRWGERSTIFANYGRSAFRLPLDLLAFGDPNGPTADVYRWNQPPGLPPSLTARGPLVARVGPGTGGSLTFTVIDAKLKRPYADEIAIGFDAHPSDRLSFRITGIARRESNLIQLVNTGVTAAAYSTSTVFDPGSDTGSTADDRYVPVYNRLPSSFGAGDRYLLVQAPDNATFAGLEITTRLATPRFLLLAGATAGMAKGNAAAPGFGPLENDQTLPGDLLVTPNSATYERGRLFNDRAYTIKLTGIYHLPAQFTLGAIARYQDGQPFARMLAVPTLNQGADAVRAFANGDSRFTYIGTLDVRLQKQVGAAGGRWTVYADGYNLVNLSNSIEEQVAAPPNVRIPTAVQPPRAFHIGVRVAF